MEFFALLELYDRHVCLPFLFPSFLPFPSRASSVRRKRFTGREECRQQHCLVGTIQWPEEGRERGVCHGPTVHSQGEVKEPFLEMPRQPRQPAAEKLRQQHQLDWKPSLQGALGLK